MPVTSEPSRPLVVERSLGYRASRAAARRRRRRRIGTGLLAGVALAAVAAGALRLFGAAGGPHRSGLAAAATERTLLLALQDPAGQAPATALLAADPAAGTGAEVLLPAGLLADAPGYGSRPISGIPALPHGTTLDTAALANLLGVRVDLTWMLPQATFVRLVDAVGGLPVTVSSPVPGISPGHHVLSGPQAWEYAVYRAPAEDGQAPLPRLQAVLDALLTRLPPSASGVTARLAAAGIAHGQAAALAGALAEDRAQVVANGMLYSELPVIPVDGGQASPLYRIDPAGLQQLLSGPLAGARLADTGPGRRVLVENAVGTPTAGTSAATRLTQAGFTFAGDQTVPAATRPARSVVLVFQDTAAAQALGTQLAHALGLPASAVAYSPRGQSVADMVVILGADYRP